jgi:hypothetical protein
MVATYIMRVCTVEQPSYSCTAILALGESFISFISCLAMIHCTAILSLEENIIRHI